MTMNEMVAAFNGQCAAADMWFGEYVRHKDPASLRNAAFALGRVQGAYRMIQASGLEISTEVRETHNRYSLMFNELV